MGLGGFQNFMARHHHAKVDDVVVVALQHDTHNVLAYIVYIALHRGHEYAPFGGACRFRLGLLLGFEVWQQIGDGFFHDACALHYLWKKHLTGPEEVTHDIHAVHQRTFDELKGPIELLAGFLDIRINVLIESFHQGVCEPLFYGQLPPSLVTALCFATSFAFVAPSQLNQPFCGIRPSVEEYIFYVFE